MGFDDNNRQTASGRHGASASRGGSHAYGQPPADGFGQAPHGSRPYPQGGGYASRPTGQTPYPNQRPANYGYASQADEIVRVRKKRKKHTKLKRAALIALAVVVVLVGGVAAYGAWYTSSLASNMALDAQEQSELSSVLAPSDSQMEPFYVLLVGSDNWETYGERSDALVLVRIDPVGHVITMVSIPRDTPYEYNGKVEKINQVFAVNGAAGAVTAVQDLTGVKISDYVEIEFAGLAEFVDSIGGIYVDVPYTIDYQVYTQDQAPVHIEAGNQLLNGEQGVALARMLAARPGILMLDEPFSALDAHLKSVLEQNLVSLFDAFHGTVLYVSHDIDEALRFCDRIAVVEAGRITETGTGDDLVNRPQSLAGVKLSGCKNATAAVRTGEHRVRLPKWGIEAATSAAVPEDVKALGVRAFFLQRVDGPGENCYRVRVDRVSDSRFERTVLLGFLDRDESEAPTVSRTDDEMKYLHQHLFWRVDKLAVPVDELPHEGEELWIRIPPDKVYLVSR